MTGKTHLAAGMAAALCVSAPNTLGRCALIMTCGALGGVFADTDALKSDRRRDAIFARACSLAALAAFLVFALYLETDFAARLDSARPRVLTGAAGLVLLWLAGTYFRHRGFMHSLPGMALFTLCAHLVYPPVTSACLAGYASHLLLDLFNKKGLRLLWPLSPTFCLTLCRADGAADKLLFLFSLAIVALQACGFLLSGA